jgi:NAD(P)H dehydrogenase (quinone)
VAARNQTLLVTGAAGQLGRQVVRHLVAARAGRIVAATRDTDKLKDLAAEGIEVRRADFDDAGSLAKAFTGVDRALIISTDALGRPGGRHAHHADAVRAATAAGVRHLLYTSITSPRPDAADPIAEDHFWTEAAIMASNAGWTILRNNLYDDVILWTLPHAVKSGEFVTATGGGSRSYVTRADCAATAAAALAADFDGKRILDVTGPAAVTQDEIAAIAADLSGRKVVHRNVTAAERKKGLVAAGVPELYADVTVGFETSTAQGYLAIVTSAVERLTGRKPIPVRDFLAAHKAALAA